MHHLEFDVLLLGPNDQVRVRGRPERIAHNQQGNVNIFCIVQDVVGALFDQFAVGDDQLATIKLFLCGHTDNCRC